MIIGCYAMDLYCDNGVEVHTYAQRVPGQFNGETASECRKAARQAGWKLDIVNRKCYCPHCVKAGRVPAKAS